MLYKCWGFVRQSLVRIGLLGEKILFKLSCGKMPKALFSLNAGAEKVETNVKIIKESDYSTDIAKVDNEGKITEEPFKIMSSTDFHYDEDLDNNLTTTRMFVRHIKEQKPDLIILTGDIILSKYQQVDAIKFAQMMEKIGVYWTAVFGNHETREEKGFYKWLLMKSFCDYPHFIGKFGPKELHGYGNHTINILGADGKINKTLFLFDSGRDINDEIRERYSLPKGLKGYDFIKREQIDFYENELDRIEKEQGKVESFVYMHIPLCEYEKAFKLDDNKNYVPTGELEILYGSQYESVGCSPYNSGFFEKIVERGSTKAVFAGHDHVNDWCATYKGVYLVYSCPQAYNAYHLGTVTGKPEREWLQGVTLTTVNSDGSFDIKAIYNSKFLYKENENGK